MTEVGTSPETGPPRAAGKRVWPLTGWEELVRALQDCGLQGYEARVLLALLRVGSANSVQLANLASVPRTSTYRVMKGLAEQGLAERLPSQGTATWTCHGWEAVVDVLDIAELNRSRARRARIDRLRLTLPEIAWREDST